MKIPKRIVLSLAVWADGVERVIHARDWGGANDLAQRLSSVLVVSVTFLEG